MIRIVLPLFLIIVVSGCSGGITEVGTTDYDSLVKSGWDEYNRTNYNEAYQLFIKAKDKDDTKPDAYIGCGWSLLKRQHPDSAIVVFRSSFDYLTSLSDSVDTMCGLSGSYLAAGENTNIVNLFKKYTVSSYEEAFPLKKHDFFLDTGDLEIVQAMAFYRLDMYSSAEQPDPDNATYHLNQALFSPYDYTDPQALMEKITDYLDTSNGGYYKLVTAKRP